jgi:hypothetical protein
MLSGDTFIVTLHDIVRIPSKNTLDCQKKSVVQRNRNIKLEERVHRKKNARKKCCMEKQQCHMQRKVNVKTHIFALNVHFWGLHLFVALFA